MDESTVTQYITETFEGTVVVTAEGNHFFFYGEDRMMPFVTLATDDSYDPFSDLTRPGIFRLNIGLNKKTYQSLFPTPDSEHDFTTLDCLMPHPVYAPQHWVCLLNPSEATLKTIDPLLAEAYDLAVRKETKRLARQSAEEA
jgi:hypothetical protein